MLRSKGVLIEAIATEISERETTMRECEGYDLTDEINELTKILVAVNNEQPLDFTQYSWLCDLLE